MTIGVLIADDEELVRAGLAMLLSAEPDLDVVGEATDGARAIAVAAEVRPDVVLIDVRMPGIDGVEATRTLARQGFPVLILTTYHADEVVHSALRAGASGFLFKDMAPQELSRAVRAVAAGHAWLAPSVTRDLLNAYTATPDRTLPTPESLAALTARERQVLALAALGMSNAEIAAHLVLGEATVKTHFGRVLIKLGLRDRANAVAVAYQTGLVTPGRTNDRDNRSATT